VGQPSRRAKMEKKGCRQESAATTSIGRVGGKKLGPRDSPPWERPTRTRRWHQKHRSAGHLKNSLPRLKNRPKEACPRKRKRRVITRSRGIEGSYLVSRRVGWSTDNLRAPQGKGRSRGNPEAKSTSRPSGRTKVAQGGGTKRKKRNQHL